MKISVNIIYLRATIMMCLFINCTAAPNFRELLTFVATDPENLIRTGGFMIRIQLIVRIILLISEYNIDFRMTQKMLLLPSQSLKPNQVKLWSKACFVCSFYQRHYGYSTPCLCYGRTGAKLAASSLKSNNLPTTVSLLRV